MSGVIVHEQSAPAQHLPSHVVGLNRTRGDWTAHLADGRTAPISEKRARALLATATVVDFWTFGVYSNWCIRGGQGSVGETD